MEEEILTSKEKSPILRLTIREFRNKFSTYWPLVAGGSVIIVLNRKVPIIMVSPYTNDILERK